MKTPVLISLAVCWVATLAGAWWLGHHSGATAEANRQAVLSPAAIEAPGKPKAPGQAGPKTSDESPGSEAGGRGFEEVFAQVKRLMRPGMAGNPMASMKVLTLLAQIREEDLVKALEAAEEFTDPQGKMMIHMVLLSRWAEKDAPAALRYAEENLKGQGMMHNMVKMSVLSAWAEHDPSAAWEHFQQLDAEASDGGMMGERGMMVMGLFSSMASKDLDAAFTRFDQLEDENERRMALMGLGMAGTNEEIRQRLMEKISALPDAEERKSTRAAVLGQLAMFEPDQAIALTASLPPEEKREVSRQMGSMLLMNDPKKGAAFILENAEPDKKAEAYDQIIGQWAGMNTNAAGAWLGEQPQGPELDNARATFARIASGKDPESAMEWAKTVSQEEARSKAVGQVYQTWKKKDEAAANAALERAGLNTEQLQRLREAPPK